MSLPIAIFYHCCFFKGPPLELFPNTAVIPEQIGFLQRSGLTDAASHFLIGVNGGAESQQLIQQYLPAKAQKVLHGIECKNENLTILAMERWVKDHPNWLVLYLHCKGVSYPPNIQRGKMDRRWRNCMTYHLVWHWKQCVADLAQFESVGCHWMTWTNQPQMPPGQSIWAGNFWWARSNFLATLPSIADTARVKLSGIGAPISRYESEVWIGNGPRLPSVKDYADHNFQQCP